MTMMPRIIKQLFLVLRIVRSTNSVVGPVLVWTQVGLLLLGLSTTARAADDESISLYLVNQVTNREEAIRKALVAERVVLWTLVDFHDDFAGKYVKTQGYLATVDQEICLFPSKEYYEALFLEYATSIPQTGDPLTKYSPRNGDYVEIVARVTENRRWDQVSGIGYLFDEFVEIRESLAGPVRRYLEDHCDNQCQKNGRGHPRLEAEKHND